MLVYLFLRIYFADIAHPFCNAEIIQNITFSCFLSMFKMQHGAVLVMDEMTHLRALMHHPSSTYIPNLPTVASWEAETSQWFVRISCTDYWSLPNFLKTDGTKHLLICDD